MKKIRKGTQAGDAAKVTALVAKLNRYRHEYYNLAAPSVPDAVYDHLFDELQELEKKTGIILSNSPTQTVGAAPVSSLKKVRHPIPLLSLDKTKQMEELLEMAGRSDSLLMLKLDGLTVKICYENGRLVEASTRGDGETGELVTHNIPAFYNVPVSIPHKGRLVVTGEGIIHQEDFERLREETADGKETGNARNLVAGSIRLLDPAACRKRHIHFYAFNVIEGMEGFGKIADSCGKLLEAMRSLGFEVCPFLPLTTKVSVEELEKGLLHTCQDFYHLDRYREEIIRMEGFGERSYENLQESIEKSRHTTFVRYVVAMDISLIGRTAGRALDSFFKGNLQELAKAAVDCFDFTSLPDFGEKMSRSIWEWFHNWDNLRLWKTLQKEFHFDEREEGSMKNRTENNPFAGCTVVATGKLAHFTRDGINSRITSLGATAGSSVTRKTDYLICGEKPGSKLAKARELGIPVLTEQEFLDMIPA